MRERWEITGKDISQSFLQLEWVAVYYYSCKKSAQLSFFKHQRYIAVAASTTVLVLLQVVFVVWEIVLVISAWWNLCIEFFRWRTGSFGCMIKKQLAFCAWDTSQLADIVQLSNIAFSRSLVASSTSLVVTWHRVSWVIDFARRCTAASLTGVGRSIPLGKAVLRVFRRRGAAGRSVHHSQCCHLYWGKSWGSVVKVIWPVHALVKRRSKRRRAPWLDVLWHRATLPQQER